MRRRLRFLRTFLAGSLALLALSPAQAKGAGMDCEHLRPDVTRLEALGEAGDPAELEHFVDSRLDAWDEAGTFCFGHLILRAVQILSSEPFEGDLQYALARRYARLGLGRAEEAEAELPLEVEVKLVLYTEVDLVTPHRPTGKAWEELRSEDMKHWFHAWKRLSEILARPWDPSDLPETNVAPPPETRLPAGVTPEAIQDPALRAEYEAAIEANRDKAERYRERHQATQLAELFFPRAKSYIIDAYSAPPEDRGGLQLFLERYVDEDDVRTEILDAVPKTNDEA